MVRSTTTNASTTTTTTTITTGTYPANDLLFST
jgi:hypothetical protein